MVVAVVRGARFGRNAARYCTPASWKDAKIADAALSDVGLFFGFGSSRKYLDALTKEGRGIMRRLSAKLWRELPIPRVMGRGE